jgi:ureidoglycolate hydrolase
MPEICDLPAQNLTAEAFAPYGTVILPMEDGVPFGPQDAELHLSGGTPRFYAMRLASRGLTFSRINRHRNVTQVLASAGGLAWLIAVAPPPPVDAADAEPEPDAIRAFRIPGDAGIMLRRGTWHAGPLFEPAEQSFFNLELSYTNVTDHWNCDLAKRYGIAFRIVPSLRPPPA